LAAHGVPHWPQKSRQRRHNREAAAAAQQERAAKEQADRQRLQADNAAYRERIAQQSPNEEFVSIQRFTNVDHAVYGTTRGNKESVKRLSDLSSIEKRLFDTFVRTSNGGRL
jgi:protein subunit release factor B